MATHSIARLHSMARYNPGQDGLSELSISIWKLKLTQNVSISAGEHLAVAEPVGMSPASSRIDVIGYRGEPAKSIAIKPVDVAASRHPMEHVPKSMRMKKRTELNRHRVNCAGKRIDRTIVDYHDTVSNVHADVLPM